MNRRAHTWWDAAGRMRIVTVGQQAAWGGWVQHVIKHAPLAGAVEGPRRGDTGDPPDDADDLSTWTPYRKDPR